MLLIQRAKEIASDFNIDELVRDIESKAHSHHTVTFPEMDFSSFISEKEIFKSNNGKELALYFHIPFCTGKCTYCQYISFPNKSESKTDEYLEALLKEIKLISKIKEVKDSFIKWVYIGGGTPTYLSSKQIDRLLKNIKNNFNIIKDAEFTFEASPETVDKEKLDVLIKNDVNRVSIGTQSFDDNILKYINRRHNSEQTIKAIELIEKEIQHINLDLIVGLPKQSLEIWENDLLKIINHKIPSVTTYPLKLKSKTRLFKQYQKNHDILSNNKDLFLMCIMAMENFKDNNYREYPVWWHIKSDKFLYKQQIHKWENNGNLIGIGVAGYSYFNGCQYYNHRNLGDYFNSLNKNKLPIWKGKKLDIKEQARRNLIFGIKCKIDRNLFNNKYDFYPEDNFKEIFYELQEKKLINYSNDIINLTYKGKLLAEEISRMFIN